MKNRERVNMEVNVYGGIDWEKNTVTGMSWELKLKA